MFESDQVSRDKLRRFDLLPGTVSLHSSLRGKRVHERLDGVTSISFFDKTDCRVDKQKEDNTDKVLPIWGFTSTVGKSDGDKSGTFHDPRQRVPHEGQELQEDVFLLLLELVGTENADTSTGLFIGETFVVTLEQLEDLLHDNVLDIDLILVVQVGSGELDLRYQQKLFVKRVYL